MTMCWVMFPWCVADKPAGRFEKKRNRCLQVTVSLFPVSGQEDFLHLKCSSCFLRANML